eukprot:symbB.v1.2.009636.t1/scaffold617.1/size180324/2
MQRWLQDGDGCLVLLTWQGLVPEAENPRQASILKLSGNNSTSNKQYEVQAASFTPYASESAEGREWIPCPVVSAAFPFEGTTCIAVRSLPFAIGQFRLFDPHTMRAGPATAPIVTVYERVEPPGTLEMVSKGDPPRTLGVQLQIPLDMPKGTGSRASCCQIRFRTMGREESDYKELQPQSLPESGAIFGTGAQPRREAFVVVREEDGLELGHVYEFQVRIGDRCRIGTWSRSFRPLRFALSLPVPLEGSGLKVVEQGDHAEISWTPFQPDVTLAAQLPGFANLPIEYTLSVLGGSCKEPLSSIVTSETRAVVHGLHPLTSYSTMLVARWSRFGKASAEGRDKDHVLMASFVTSGLGGKKVTAELSVRLPTEQLDGYGPVAPAKAKIPVQGGQPAAVTLDLDRYFVQPRLHHCSPDFVRKPTVPSQREVEDEEIAAESAGPPGKLPSLVPMPPPKFTTRDPLSFALLTPGPGASKPSGGPRPSPRRRLPMPGDVFVEGSPDEHVMSCSPSSTQLMSFKPSNVEEEEKFMHVLHRLASLCKARGVLFKHVFFDVDRAPVASPARQSPFMGGKVTREQFIRRFPFKKEFPPEDVELLAKNYMTNKGDVHFMAMHNDISEVTSHEPPDFPRSDLVLKPDESEWSQSRYTVVDKLRSKVVEGRIRIKEYFQEPT